MFRQLIVIVVFAVLVASTEGDEKNQKQESLQSNKPAAVTAEALPEAIKNFNGMVVGRLVKKDVERGEFVVTVDAVPRVWRNSKAENPKSIVGKTIAINGVTGKWLDVLLLVKPGETLEFESRHDRGDYLTFPGELLRKVAPFDPSDYPELPEEFRGFEGAVAAKVVKKDPETFELIVKVDHVLDTWKNNRAKKPKSIEGKKMMLAGFWQRKEAYHGLKTGDRIEAGVRHIGLRSDHVTVAEFVRKASKESKSKPDAKSKQKDKSTAQGLPAGLNGFRGVLIGSLKSKDVEKGEFKLKLEKVVRSHPRSEAKNPENAIGKEVTVQRVERRFLDVLITAKPGDKIEVLAFHNRPGVLDFPGELLRKVD